MGKRKSLAECQTFKSLVDIVRYRAKQAPQKIHFRFLEDGETQETPVSYEEIDAAARAIAATLQERGLRQKRVLLLYPTGLDYIKAFLGCLYAQCIAVPAYPPDPQRLDKTLPPLISMVRDSEPSAILSNQFVQSIAGTMAGGVKEFASLPWIATDAIDVRRAGAWEEPLLRGEDLAYLQYTSGSTGNPKGVMESHGGLLANLHLLARGFESEEDDLMVTWLPFHHNLCNIGVVMLSLYVDTPTVLMSPMLFLQRPLRWLEAISRYRASTAAGPNSAYDLCVQKISEEEKKSLDLSCWDLACDGSEVISGATIERFSRAFASCGFRREAFLAGYGMAEAGVRITAGLRQRGIPFQSIDRDALSKNQWREVSPDAKDALQLASCGVFYPEQCLRIVDPVHETVCAPGQIGELWAKHESNALGYWRKPEDTEKNFHAYTSDTREGPFLRTGDLGYIRGNELFISGRLKDLIIIQGKNYYPQDIEAPLQALLKTNALAAFSIQEEGQEKLVVLSEITEEDCGQSPSIDWSKRSEEIRAAISTHFELSTHGVVFLKPLSLPRTTSQKVSRFACRQAYLQGTLDAVFSWTRKQPSIARETPKEKKRESPEIEKISETPRLEIQTWLSEYLVENFDIPRDKIGLKTNFQSLGLGSKEAVMVSGDLERYLGRKLSPTLLYNYPDIESLSRELAGTPSEAPSEKLESTPQQPTTGEAVAIIGMGGRFPMAADLREFWENLLEGRDCIQEVPSSRWSLEEYYSENRSQPGKIDSRWGGFLDHVDRFAAAYFGISPREAMRMDPQQRLVLETVQEALDDAGIDVSRIAGSETGVFLGICSNDYGQLQYGRPESVDAYAGSGNAHSIAANRVSYVYDLRGPSVAIDTACSSSLVAVHWACESLKKSESALAIVAGVNLILRPELSIGFAKARMLSPEGRCKTFDAKANGYVRSEGCGVVVLKRLSEALRDGDHIWATIRGSAINQDGKSNGLTAPNGKAQEDVLRKALANAGLEASEVQCVEAHGTGTPLGDPIELEALGHVLGSDRKEGQDCWVSSVKTNIGHLESAAGIAGLIKSALVLHHQRIPKHLHLSEINSAVSLEQLKLKIPTETIQPEKGQSLRNVGVSSFGFGGANAHVILSEAPRVDENKSQSRPFHFLKMSAKTEAELRLVAKRYAEDLQRRAELSLEDFCASANLGRADWQHRGFCVAKTKDQLRQQLLECCEAPADAFAHRDLAPLGEKLKIAFLFTGQGSQYVGMGEQLYRSNEFFRRTLEECAGLARPYLKEDLLQVILGQASGPELIDETAYTQPALFALEYALAKLWMSWGIQPDLMMGHSVGEYVAACLAGVFSLADGMKLICRRAALMQSLPRGGAMLSVTAAASQVEAWIEKDPELSIAARNGPQHTVVSGSSGRIEELEKILAGKNIAAKRLKVSHAFHSVLMDPILEAFQREASEIHFQKPQLDFISNVDGKLWPRDQIPDAAYWVRHLRSCVDFAQGMRSLAENHALLFLEVGPHGVLHRLGKRCLPESPALWLDSLQRQGEDWEKMLLSLGELYRAGLSIDWRSLEEGYFGKKIPLPSYPFEKKSYWFDAGKETKAPPAAREIAAAPKSHPLLGNRIRSPLETIQYRNRLRFSELAYLKDHRVSGEIVFPATGYLEMLIAAGKDALAKPSLTLENIHFKQALFLDEARELDLQVLLHPLSMDRYRAEIFSADPAKEGGAWVLHAEATVRGDEAITAQANPENEAAFSHPTMDPQDLYRDLSKLGLQYGPQFQGIQKIRSQGREIWGEISLAEGNGDYSLHPAWLDSALQLLAAGFSSLETQGRSLYLPDSIAKVRYFGPIRATGSGHAVIHPFTRIEDPEYRADLRVMDSTGRTCVELQDFRLKSLHPRPKADSVKQAPRRNVFYDFAWEKSSVSEAKPIPPETLWLVLANGSEISQSFCEYLSQQDAVLVQAVAKKNYHRLNEYHYTLRPESLEDFRDMLAKLRSDFPSRKMNVVDFWGVPFLMRSTTELKGLSEAESLGCHGALHLAQALLSDSPEEKIRLAVVTRGAQYLEGQTGFSLDYASLWGLTRVFAVEHPELNLLSLDLDPQSGPQEVDELMREILGCDFQVLYRGGERYIPRLRADVSETPDFAAPTLETLAHSHFGSEENYRLEIDPRIKTIESIQPKFQKRAPLPEEGVEIEVMASALNFSDVLKAMGLYPGLGEGPVPLGIEGAGIVRRVGKQGPWKEGDEVMFVAPFSFTRFAVTKAALVVPKPRDLSFEEAAALPIAFTTAQYALVHLGRIQAKERVLIHAGAGGVGTAAIQIAQLAQAEIFATAGSEEKRIFLEKLGVHHVLDSRSLDFAEKIKSLTRGEGIDLVLNSLPGEYILKSLELLRPYGRFLEIGKTDIYQNSQVGLNPFRNMLSYHSIDLDYVIQHSTSLFQQLFAEVAAGFEQGRFKALPAQVFPLNQATQAFRFMAQRKNIGKVVLTHKMENADPIVSAEKSYLVTGALGNLGLQATRWLARQGARHFLLVARREPSEETKILLSELESLGAQFDIIVGDISHKQTIEEITRTMTARKIKLGGIFHAAGLLEDGILLHQNAEKIARVLAPKVQGAWNLHELSLGHPVDHFVLFSSIASVLGSPGQANYAAANAFLDQLSHYRRSLGLAALCINWGPWAGGGMAEQEATQKRLQGAPVQSIPVDQGFEMLAYWMRKSKDPAFAKEQVVAVIADWGKLAASYPDEASRAILAEVSPDKGKTKAVAFTPLGEDRRKSLEALMSSAEVPSVENILQEKVKLALGTQQKVDTSVPLDRLGLDSLMAIELKNDIEAAFGVSLPMALLFKGPSIQGLSEHVKKQMQN